MNSYFILLFHIVMIYSETVLPFACIHHMDSIRNISEFSQKELLRDPWCSD